MDTTKLIQTRGLVIETGEKGLARVVIDRKSACSGCESGKTDSCKTCLSGSNKIAAEVINPVHAQKGDIVEITLSRSNVLKGAAAFYLIPVAGLIAGALLANAWFPDKTITAVIGGGAGIVLGLIIVKWIAGLLNKDQQMIPKISHVIHAGERNIHPCPECR